MDSARGRKAALFEAIALMGKGFASPVRLELLDLLAQAPHTVQELARATEQSTANTSQHLQALQAAGLVSRRREGTSARYALAGEDVFVVATVAGNDLPAVDVPGNARVERYLPHAALLERGCWARVTPRRR